MNCPHDNSKLQPRGIWEIEAKDCSVCHGIWLSYSEIRTLYEKGALSVPAQVYSKSKTFNNYKHWESNIHCPIDNTQMETYDLESLCIDICPDCKGLWLDHGEFEKLWTGMTGKESLFVWLLEIFTHL
jgi:Zn-finger nucleic acid-binding protein